MSRSFGNAQREEKLKQIISTPAWGGNMAKPLIRLGDDLFLTDSVEEAKWGSAEGSAPTLTFEGKVAGYIEPEYENEPLEVRVLFGGFDILEFRGVHSILKYNEDNSTTISSFSPGGLLDKVPLKEFVEYFDWLPENVIRDAIYRINSYNRAATVVVPFGSPRINFNTTFGQSGFEKEDYPASILSRVFEIVGAVALDNPLAGTRVFANPYLGVGLPLAWAYDSDALLHWAIPELVAPDEQYTSVIVAHQDEGQPSAERIERKWDVNWSGMRSPPKEDIPLYIPFNDVGPNADSKAADLAVRNARALSSGRRKTTFTASYNPFLEKYDPVQVIEKFRDRKGPWIRQWLAMLDGGLMSRFSRDVALESQAACTLTLQKAQRVRDSLGALTLGRQIRTVGIIGRFTGIDALGLWWDPETAEDFSGIDPGGLWIDISHAGEYVGTTAGGLWIDPEGTGHLFDVEVDEGGLYINTEVASPKWMGIDAGGLFVETTDGFSWTGTDGAGLWLDPEGAAGA